MAFGQTQVVTLAAVLTILFAVLVFNNVAAMRTRARARKGGEGASGSSGGDAVHPLLVKFARHDGSVVGETVALDGDRLVLKQAGVFKAVPAAQAKVEGGEVVLTGPIDWPAAEQAGLAWHEARRRADAGVSGELTKSSDVKAPALDAVRSREGKA